jgi:Fic family protein
MKKPHKPPDNKGLMAFIEENPKKFFELMALTSDMNVSGKYLHWHKLRYYPPPEGYTHIEWWHAIKMRRSSASKSIPLVSKSQNNFTFNLVDPLPESLHNIDSLARGVVGMPEAITNSETKNRYLVHSLIEEAITSSQLEGASTTRKVAKEMIRQGREPHDRSERMIFNNFKTMQRIGELRNEKLTKELIFEIHRIVTDDTLADNGGAGRFRRPDENIYVGDDEGRVFHSPPDATTLSHRMEEMCKFANGDIPSGFIHPVIRSIVLHFWLAYDHPFVDGNGRTARALFYWSMLKQEYWLFEFISISDIILKAPVKYGMAFLYTETDQEDLTYFILYHTKVILRAIEKLNEYIKQKTESIRTMEANLRGLSVLNHRQRALERVMNFSPACDVI